MSDLRPVSAWELWANPILKRYCRSRLRKKHLVPWALLIIIVSLFIVFLMLTVTQRADQVSLVSAARVALIPLTILQMFLLMFLGTGAVASGIARESVDGMVDYQRLTPMTPLAKILGYLFGLPIREYVLTGLTFIPLSYVLFIGEVPLGPAIKFYGVFFSASMLYHLTGLVAGSVVKKKFLAGRTAQFFVIILYLVLPRFSNLGFVFLIYLTVIPAWFQQALPFIGDVPVSNAFLGLDSTVPWFRWDFSPTEFSFIIQGSLILVFVVILARKWRDPNAHILGHVFAVLAFAGYLSLLLGNTLPLIRDGQFYAGNFFGGRVPSAAENVSFGWITMGLMGVAIFLTILLVQRLIVPTRDEALRGFRRAVKQGRTRVRWHSDDNTSLPFVIVLLGLGSLGWTLFCQSIFASTAFRNVPVPPGQALMQFMGIALPLLALQLVIEWRGWRSAVLLGLFIWVVPPLAAIIIAAGGSGENLAFFAASLSGPMLPVFAVLQASMESEVARLAGETARNIQSAYWFSVTLYALSLPYLFTKWRQYRKDLYELAKTQEKDLGSESGTQSDDSLSWSQRS